MIDEKKLIDRLRNMEYSRCPSLECWEHSSKDCGYCEEREIKAGDAIKIVNELSSEHNNEWIPCSERLPENEGMYLITSKLFNAIEIQYVFYQKNIEHFICNGKAIAWMPLPEPYKGE